MIAVAFVGMPIVPATAKVLETLFGRAPVMPRLIRLSMTLTGAIGKYVFPEPVFSCETNVSHPPSALANSLPCQTASGSCGS